MNELMTLAKGEFVLIVLMCFLSGAVSVLLWMSIRRNNKEVLGKREQDGK